MYFGWQLWQSSFADGRSDEQRSPGEAKQAIREEPVSRRFDVNQLLALCHHNEEGAATNISSSNSTVDTSAIACINSDSGYRMDFKRMQAATEELENDKACSRVHTDVEEKGATKKKPRLSEEQYAILEESFSNNRLPTMVSLSILII